MRGDVNGKRGLLRRLRRVEGQVRGIQRMVVLTQISSVVSTLEVVAVSLIGEHLKECVAEAAASGAAAADVKVREMSNAVARLVRS
jgi:CsoR family transcriptional regulator, copper-sensing transcriptional repressor